MGGNNEKLEPLKIIGGKVKWCHLYGKQLLGSSKSSTQNYHMVQQFYF
jgi:hypothetical protein